MKKLNLDIQMFASTNKTTNYELPQFVGTDKPTWLGDVNSAMSIIDGAMHENASDIESLDTRVSSAESSASQASQDVTTLTGRVNTLQTNVESATTAANNAQQTATSALNTANTANGKADTNASDIESLDTRVSTAEANILNFNLTNYTSATVSKVSGQFTISSSSINVATNSDGSLAKIYGVITCSNVGASGSILIQTPLRPSEAITINGGCLSHSWTTSRAYAMGGQSYTIATDGTITLPMTWAGANGETRRLVFINSLIFVKDFGDIVIPEE